MPRSTDIVPAKRAKGPASRITLTRLESIVGYIGNGMPKKSAAAATGIHETTFHAWVRRGRLHLVEVEDTKDVDPYELIDTMKPRWPETEDWAKPESHFDPVEWPFVVFALAVEKAEAAFEARALSAIQKAALGADGKPQSWQAAAWLLERKYPEQYGRPEARLQVQTAVTTGAGGVQVETRVVSVEELESRLDEVLEGEVVEDVDPEEA